MIEKAGMINRYTCKKCLKGIVTINRDEGTTPAFIDCPWCGGMMSSHWYRVQQTTEVLGVPVYEWYRPPKERWKKLDPVVREHVEQGGLLLRKRLPPKPEQRQPRYVRRRRSKNRH